MKEIIQKVSDERMIFCSPCEFNSKNCTDKLSLMESLRIDEHCVLCGCTLSAKTKCLSCECDVHKWDAVMTEQEEEEILEENGKEETDIKEG